MVHDMVCKMENDSDRCHGVPFQTFKNSKLKPGSHLSSPGAGSTTHALRWPWTGEGISVKRGRALHDATYSKQLDVENDVTQSPIQRNGLVFDKIQVQLVATQRNDVQHEDCRGGTSIREHTAS